MKKESTKAIRPRQTQRKQPGVETVMKPQPEFFPKLTGKKLAGKVAVITGGDSGIGRAVAIAFANEGASVFISYFNEHKDAKETASMIEKMGAEVEILAGDISDEKHCKKIIKSAVKRFGKLNILVNNAAVQYPQKSIEDISQKQLEETFRVNIFSQFFLTKAALPEMQAGGNIICTTSVTAYRGSPELLDYSSTKGAIVAFVRSLAASLADKQIRVNGVAPGPIWTPLIPATFDAQHVSEFGSDAPMRRAGQPNEVAPAFVFLASDDASFITGQIIHINGGEVVNA